MNFKLFKNYLYNIFHIFGTILFPLLFFPYVSRILGPEYYGKYNFALSITSYFLILAGFGTQYYGIKELIKAKNESKENFQKKLTEIIIIGFIMSLFSFALYIGCIYSIPILKENKILYWVVGIPIISSFLIVDYVFIALEKYKRRTFRLLTIKLICLVLIFTFVKKEADYITFAMIIIGPEFIMRLIDVFSIKRYLTLKHINIKKHLRPLMYIFFYAVSTNIYLNIDSTMLGLLKGDIEVGYYAVSIKLVKIMIPITTSLGVVLSNSIIEKIKNNELVEIYNDIDLYSNFISFLSFPIIFLLILLKNELIVLLVGEIYLEAGISMIIMLPIIIFISMSRFYSSQLLIPLDKEKNIFYISLVGVFCNFTFNYILIPRYGVIGAAIGTLISEFIVFNFRLSATKKIFSEHYFFSIKRIYYIIAGLISFASTYVLLSMINCNSLIIKIVVGVTFYSILYILILFLKKEYFIMLGIKTIKKLFERKESFK